MIKNRSTLVIAFIVLGCFATASLSDEFRPLTIEEYNDLGKEEAQQYLADLQKAYDDAKARERDAGDIIDEEQRKIDNLKSQFRMKNIEESLNAMENRYNVLMGKVSYFRNLPGTHTVMSGECLYEISSYEHIYDDPLKWPRIHRANRDLIKDPDLIYPDWILNIPRDWPTQHTVYEGESLSRIANYWEIYDNPARWTELYKYNEDQIKDPDLIYPDQILTFPKDR
jgi:nucleoid-associated protein YgaU